MSASFDEINNDALTVSNTVNNVSNSTLNSNKINNNNTIQDHPLSNVQINKNNNTNDNFEDEDDDMMEVNLKLDDNDKNPNKLMNTNQTLEISNNNNNIATSQTDKTTTTPNTNQTNKSNWVKFDEENNETIQGRNSNENSYNGSNNNSNNNNINNNSLNNSSIQTQKSEAQIQTSPHNIINTSKSQQKALKQPTQVDKITSMSAASSSGVAVLKTESTHVNIDRMNTSNVNSQNNNNDGNRNNSSINQNNAPKNVAINIPTSSPIRTVELSTGRIREGFANGDIIVNLLPTNTKWPWITPAVFRPELVPEELMAQGLSLTVEEYVAAMESLVNDYRFTLYNICYKRVLVCWITFAFCVLLVLLFSGLQGIALFSLGVAWLFLNAAAIFACMWMKLRLSRGLEKCLGRVNKQLLRHKILLVLDDRGRISCHKVNLCFMYFDPAQCIAYLNEFLERQEQLGNSIQAGWEKKLDVEVNDIIIQGSNPVRLSRKQEMSTNIFLRYASRWGNEVLRGLADVSITEPSRHCASYMCPCQFIERHLSCKPRGYPCSCCFYMSDPNSIYRF